MFKLYRNQKSLNRLTVEGFLLPSAETPQGLCLKKHGWVSFLSAGGF